MKLSEIQSTITDTTNFMGVYSAVSSPRRKTYGGSVLLLLLKSSDNISLNTSVPEVWSDWFPPKKKEF